MNDEQDTLYNMNSTTPIPPNIQPGILVAVATLVLAGSAVFWRSNLRLGNLRLLPNVSGSEQPNASLEDEHAGQDVAESSSLNDGLKSQNSRSKERRKRRKDPMKELMKGGRRAKDLAKLLKHVDLPGSGDPSSSSAPNSASASAPLAAEEPSSSATRSGNLKRNRSASRSESGVRDPSASCSSRSVSISSNEPFTRGHPSEEDAEEQQETPLTAMPSSPVLPLTTNLGHSPSTSYDSTAVSTFSFESAYTADTSVQSALEESTTPSSFNSSKNTRRNKNGNSKNSTPDNINNLHTNGAPITISTSTAPYTPQKDTGSSSSTLNAAPSSSSSTLPRAGKPPRFRSQTRQEPGTAQENPTSGAGLAFSTSMPIYSTFRASSSTPKLDSEYTEEDHVENVDSSPSPIPFNFPSLNGASDSSKASSVTGFTTPPPGSTNSNSLSTQTQIASLRGALEASRKREEEAKGRAEKTRSELEQLGNEVTMLRWEGSAWRQREAELQAQVHHLAHQIQSYAAYFAHPPQPPQAFPQLQNLAIPQPQRPGKNYPRGKRQTASSASSRSTSKSSRPSHSSQPSPIPSLAQLPEEQTSQGSSSPSVGSPVVPQSGMFSPSMTFSPGPSSTPYPHNLGPFSPLSSFGMFSPTGPPPRGVPFASPPLGSAGMMSPLSPQSSYMPYAPYPAYAGAPQGSKANGNSSNGAKMHPMQFLNMLNSGNSGETGGMSASSTMSSLASGTESTESMSPESTSSPSPTPGSNVRGRGRKRGRGVPAGTATTNGDRMAFGYGPEFQYSYPYGYSYPYPAPNSYLPGASSPRGDSCKEDNLEGATTGGNDDSNSEDGDDEGGQLNELLAGAILKRPESMMGLRSGSGSGRSSKSNSKAKDKLQLSPTDVARDGFGDETMIISPGSDSGLGLGLDWLKDPGLFRREAADVSLPAMAKPLSTDSNEIDLDTEFSSSSSSSTKSTSASSESPAKALPIEFSFPSIATGYSYQTHSATDFDDKNTANVAEISYESPAEEDLVDETTLNDPNMEEETTPPADKASNLNHLLDAPSSDSTITLDEQHCGTAPSDHSISG